MTQACVCPECSFRAPRNLMTYCQLQTETAFVSFFPVPVKRTKSDHDEETKRATNALPMKSLSIRTDVKNYRKKTHLLHVQAHTYGDSHISTYMRISVKNHEYTYMTKDTCNMVRLPYVEFSARTNLHINHRRLL